MISVSVYVETRSCFIFVNDLRSKQNEKNPEHPIVDIGKWETCAKFQQKIFDCMVDGALWNL